jgi:Barstar (barnase inhibitor)
MSERWIASAATKRGAISAIYAAVDAPDWAAPNLDGLADVLRDLSWLPPGRVTLVWRPSPQLSRGIRASIEEVLCTAVAESATSDHPLRIKGIR